MRLAIDRQQQLRELCAAYAGIELVAYQFGIATFAGDRRIVAQDRVSSWGDHQLLGRERRVQALAAAADLGEYAFYEMIRLRRQMMPIEEGSPCRSPTHRRQ